MTPDDLPHEQAVRLPLPTAQLAHQALVDYARTQRTST